MALRKKTLRKMMPGERKYAVLLTELDSVLRRLRNLQDVLASHEFWARAGEAKEEMAAAEKAQLAAKEELAEVKEVRASVDQFHLPLEGF